ncbi:TonB-dependent receptor [Acinetobacter qingfengensis]|uniref:TonB-dependent receptor n=1 Tax=Acinetobacter qingfengensis TaxID=1262585 RepID=A0A1E7R6N3_9GAMM|nr:TonB-dependent receptor [Acinetobacter qingfengensis]KAA8734677.1 TonB-dependent receptor [Acinetobacter qingfengensis]OEY94947.1 TonB-dependent receptor [Acinetobacter qingfengensis]
MDNFILGQTSSGTVQKATILKPLVMSIHLALCAGALLYSASVQADSATAMHYQVARGTLGQALSEFSLQSGIQISIEADLVSGLQSQGLAGVYPIDEGFRKLLQDTGLQAVQTKNGYILVKQQIKQNNQPKYIGELKQIDVQAQGNSRDVVVGQLPAITVDAIESGSAKDSYLVKKITGVGPWGERSLQDTPYSITVIPKELIENVQANDMAKIFKMNPITQDGGDQWSGNYYTVIRGFSSNNAVINGLALADWYSFTTMEDLEKVETISGATGFLYGGGRVGGAVNYVTKKPTLDNQRIIKVGNYGGDQYYVHLDLSGQIDKENIFGYRMNALYQDGDSVVDVGKKQKFISVTLDYKPTDNFYMDLNYAHRDMTRNGQKIPINVTTNTVRPKIDTSKSYSPDWTSTDEKNDRLMSSLKWNINDTFTLRGALLYEKSNRAIGVGPLAYTRADGLYDVYLYKYPDQGQEIKNLSGGVYLDSRFEAFGIQHLLTTGYSENYNKYFRTRNWAIYETLPAVTLKQIKDAFYPTGTIANSAMLPMYKTQYKNILIGDDITFNDQWSALVGFNYATIVQTTYSSGVKQPAYDKSKLTPTLSFMYKPFKALTTYVTYMESLEQGTIVDDTYSNSGEILDPLVSKQYEAGIKYSLLNEKLLLTSALFRIEKANQYSDNVMPMPKYVQDGKEIHQGLELTFTGKVTENLTIMGGGTWMDLSIEKTNDAELEGKKPTNAASKMAKIYAEYNIPLIDGLTVTGGVYYTGEKYGNSANTDKIPAYTLLDIGARLITKIAQYPTTFNLTLSNLTGKDYWASSTYLGDPRTIAFSVKTQF